MGWKKGKKKSKKKEEKKTSLDLMSYSSQSTYLLISCLVGASMHIGHVQGEFHESIQAQYALHVSWFALVSSKYLSNQYQLKTARMGILVGSV